MSKKKLVTVKRSTKAEAAKPWRAVTDDVINIVKYMPLFPGRLIDLAVVDPPYNQDVEYTHHRDRMPKHVFINDYLGPRLAAIRQQMSPTGTMWVAMNDDNIAELKIYCQQVIGLTVQHHVIAYTTFGQAHTKRMARSKIHWLHMTVHPTKFTFNHQDPAVRVPSARQMIYNDKRANSRGKLPDDTWILRPQDVQADLDDMTNLDLWSYSRICGTFKAKIRHVPNQLNVEMLKRIIRLSSNTGDLVSDGFNGTGTAGEAAVTLGRFYLGIDIAPASAPETDKRLTAAMAKTAPTADDQMRLFSEK